MPFQLNRFNRHRPSLTSAVLLAAGSAVATSAHAQCDIYRPGLPDFDQRREAGPGVLGLPNNGSVHCVPTSAADAVAFAANHGAPELLFNQMWDWDSPATYNVATDLINDLGVLMGTAGSGTTSSGYVNGMTAFINARSPGRFVASSIGWANGFGPSPERVHNLIAQGGFVLVVRGTYAPEPGNPGVLNRTGGHILLARNVYDACSAAPNIGMRDPNSGDSRFVNSPWGVYREDMNAFNATFRLGNGTTQARNYWEWSNDYGANHKVMDGLLTFIPTFAIGGAVINGEEVGVNIIRPSALTGPNQPPQIATLMLPPESGPISSVELMPDFGWIVVFSRPAAAHGGGGGQGKVSVHDISITKVFDDGPEFLTPVVDTCTSPAGGIFACEEHQVSLLARFQDGSVRVVRSVSSADSILACAFDDDADRFVIITGSPTAGAHVKVFDGSLSNSLPLFDAPLPPQVVFNGAVGLCVDPNDGGLVCCSEGLGVIYRLARNATGGLTFNEAIALPAGAVPRNPHVNDAGSILFTSNGGILEFHRDDLNNWRQNFGSTFSEFKVGRSFSLATSRDGMSRTEPTGPDASNIADERLESARDCPADFNDDGFVDPLDYNAFINAFESGDTTADFNGDGFLDPLDYNAFINAFEAGC